MNQYSPKSLAIRIGAAIILALLLFWVGTRLHADMTAYENGESDLVMNSILLFFYDVAGKWGALTAWGVVGTFVIGLMCFGPKGNADVEV